MNSTKLATGSERRRASPIWSYLRPFSETAMEGGGNVCVSRADSVGVLLAWGADVGTQCGPGPRAARSLFPETYSKQQKQQQDYPQPAKLAVPLSPGEFGVLSKPCTRGQGLPGLTPREQQ